MIAGLPGLPELARYVRERYVQARLLAEPRENAPQDYATLALSVRMDAAGRTVIPVWSGASEHTIWRTKRENYVFRAWHDHEHLRTGIGFSHAEESSLADIALRSARLAGVSPAALRILNAELRGQVEHHAEHGVFPENQRAFVIDYLNCWPERARF